MAKSIQIRNWRGFLWSAAKTPFKRAERPAPTPIFKGLSSLRSEYSIQDSAPGNCAARNMRQRSVPRMNVHVCSTYRTPHRHSRNKSGVCLVKSAFACREDVRPNRSPVETTTLALGVRVAWRWNVRLPRVLRARTRACAPAPEVLLYHDPLLQ